METTSGGVLLEKPMRKELPEEEWVDSELTKEWPPAWWAAANPPSSHGGLLNASLVGRLRACVPSGHQNSVPWLFSCLCVLESLEVSPEVASLPSLLHCLKFDPLQ